MARHVYACHTRFSDVDVYGHVNNVKYFEYYQEARVSMMSAMAGADGAGRLPVVVASLRVDYKRPILFRTDPYVIESWVNRVGNSSFAISAEIKDGDTVLSRAEAGMVTFDLETQRARPLTSHEREWLLTALEE